MIQNKTKVFDTFKAAIFYAHTLAAAIYKVQVYKCQGTNRWNVDWDEWA